MRATVFAALAGVAVAAPGQPSSYGYNNGNAASSLMASLQKQLQGGLPSISSLAPVTSQILKDYLEPIEVGFATILKPSDYH